MRYPLVSFLFFLALCAACDQSGSNTPVDADGSTNDTDPDQLIIAEEDVLDISDETPEGASGDEDEQIMTDDELIVTDDELVVGDDALPLDDEDPVVNDDLSVDDDDAPATDDATALTDDEPVATDDDWSDDDIITIDIYTSGDHSVLRKDIETEADDNSLAMRIFYPAEAGTYPCITFIHGLMLKDTYYDQVLAQLSSHGFIVISPQLAQSLMDDKTSIDESDEVLAFIADWVAPKLAAQTAPAVPDLTRSGLSGHSYGAKVSWRMMIKNPDDFHAIIGIDPLDIDATAGGDPQLIITSDSYLAPSAVIGTEMGPADAQACAPTAANSSHLYPILPSPAWHLIAGDVGHMDMIDADDLASCGPTCSLCSGGDAAQKATFRTLCGGLLVAFFRASLYGETDLYGKLVDTTGMPHPIITQENK